MSSQVIKGLKSRQSNESKVSTFRSSDGGTSEVSVDLNGLVLGDDQNPVIKNMIHLQVKKQKRILEKAHKI